MIPAEKEPPAGSALQSEHGLFILGVERLPSRSGQKIMELESTFVCPYCLQLNTVMVDVSAGLRQEYIEDCEVCCRPTKLMIVLSPDLEEAAITADIP